MNPALDIPTEASCTTCTFTEDFSNYWTPTMYFRARNGTFKRVPQIANQGFNGAVSTPTLETFFVNLPDSLDPSSNNHLGRRYDRLLRHTRRRKRQHHGVRSRLSNGCRGPHQQNTGRIRRRDELLSLLYREELRAESIWSIR